MSNPNSIPYKKRNKNGRTKTGPTFTKIYRNMSKSPLLDVLSPHSCKLLLQTVHLYNGKNNGDICLAFSVMKKRGWKSSATLNKSIKDLLDKGFLIKTRQGGLNMGCCLYAFGWEPIDECNGKIDINPTTTAPTQF